MGLRKESIKWSQKCLDNTIKIDKQFPYLVFRELAADMIKNGQASQVLEKLSYALKRYPPSDPQRTVFIPMIQGDCYMALKQPQLAEKYYLQAIALFNKLHVHDSYYSLCCNNIADFYVGQKLYNKAAPYLQEIFANPNPMFSVANLAAAHQLQFKIDSASRIIYQPLSNLKLQK
jgi:tetratricopeptide (TPR) repeat protein